MYLFLQFGAGVYFYGQPLEAYYVLFEQPLLHKESG